MAEGGSAEGTGFAERLKALRAAAGLSQAALAAAANMHPMAVAKLEQAKYEPGWPTVLALAAALGCALDDFRAAPPAAEPPAPAKRTRKAPRRGRSGG